MSRRAFESAQECSLFGRVLFSCIREQVERCIKFAFGFKLNQVVNRKFTGKHQVVKLSCKHEVYGKKLGCKQEVYGKALGCKQEVYGKTLGCKQEVYGKTLGCKIRL